MWWPLSRCEAGTAGRQIVGWRWTAPQRRSQATVCLWNSRWCRHLRHEALVRQTPQPTAKRNTETERVRMTRLHLRGLKVKRLNNKDGPGQSLHAVSDQCCVATKNHISLMVYIPCKLKYLVFCDVYCLFVTNINEVWLKLQKWHVKYHIFPTKVCYSYIDSRLL